MIRKTLIAIMAAAALFGAAHAQDPAPAPAPAPEAAAPAPAPEAAPAAPAAAPAPDLRQVQLQVWISETSEQGIRDVGANLDYTRFVRGEEQGGSVERIATNVFDVSNANYSVTLPAPDLNPYPDNLRPDRSGTLADGVQSEGGAGLTFSIIDTGRGTIDGLFRAIERKSDVDLISKPELLVVNGKPAEIHAGGEVPYQSVTYNPSGIAVLNVTWEKVGVNLNITPTIVSDEMIRIDIAKLDVTDVARIDNIRGMDLPVFSTRTQTGAVMVPDRQALVFGGLSSRLIRKTEQRVPVVGTIPLIGIPFRGRKSEAINNHLLIFVAPTIVDLADMQPDTVNALNFWRNSEWKNSERIGQEIQAFEEDL